ncbi:hypothetical protein [Pedobacter hiemivivus]|nr:hypothetical protein [Pedobacter hiemivivus]
MPPICIVTLHRVGEIWYKGLAQGGTAIIGMVVVTVGVIMCVAGTKKFAK